MCVLHTRCVIWCFFSLFDALDENCSFFWFFVSVSLVPWCDLLYMTLCTYFFFFFFFSLIFSTCCLPTLLMVGCRICGLCSLSMCLLYQNVLFCCFCPFTHGFLTLSLTHALSLFVSRVIPSLSFHPPCLFAWLPLNRRAIWGSWPNMQDAESHAKDANSGS